MESNDSRSVYSIVPTAGRAHVLITRHKVEAGSGAGYVRLCHYLCPVSMWKATLQPALVCRVVCLPSCGEIVRVIVVDICSLPLCTAGLGIPLD